MAWTQFWDMHSGGDQKEKWAKIYIEAPEDEAIVIFYNRFGHNPERVTCTCCGPDYSIDEQETFAEISAYHRNCKWDKEKRKYVEQQDPLKAKYEHYEGGEQFKYKTPEEYSEQLDVLVIPATEIEDDERTGHVPDEGYIWVGG